ncbi:MAG: tetratricopeptide repeat protein [Bryobacteraceae bacterium]|nr:tetratricopeptide repeat protein [Bryobacteraceae bacterium]
MSLCGRFLCAAAVVWLLCLASSRIPAAPAGESRVAPIAIDYPAEGAVFPPETTAPTFLWRDPEQAATLWRIEVTFEGGGEPVRAESPGDRLRIGEIDPQCARAGAVPPELTPLEAEAHAWKPDAAAWAAIKKNSIERRATVTISGYSGANAAQALSWGKVTIRTSKDPVGAPLFYRDVPLIPVPIGERGVIMPLPAGAVPLIAWRLFDIAQSRSKVMMQGLPTCANCHSFSADGKTLGLDVDGPQNDKGLYGLVTVSRETSIRNEDVIRWSSFSEERASKRFGFMSQVSPDGQYVVTSIENPGTRVRGLDSRLYNGFYKDYGFGQVFYPTRGILAWYSRATGQLQPLPGADDPNYVQAGAFWSPDGKYLVFSRAPAKDPYHEGQPEAQYANDSNETQIQYDLYRIPFNEGRGGTAEPVAGASNNGMSNNFPKVSPDGRWIVYVQCRNGLLMRPDSELYIVPFHGGRARRLNANTPRLNSWHSFSPNGRWLAFSSKGRSLYTQLYLTHFDPDGNDSPAILLENATAANRAVNIPEFLNILPDGLARMDAPATEFYRLCDVATDLAQKGQHGPAVYAWRKALDLDRDDAKARFNLAVSLQNNGRMEEAAVEYRKSLAIEPENAAAQTNLGVALIGLGKPEEAIEPFRKALAIDPVNTSALSNLGAVLIEQGQIDEAIGYFRTCLEAAPGHAEAHNSLGIALARKGELDEAVSHLEKAVESAPASLEYRYNLGRVLAARHKFQEAIPHLERAVELSGGGEPLSLDMLAAMYSEVGRLAEAARVARRALEIAVRANNPELARMLKAKLDRYESGAQSR